jgi:hypothetical protein
MKEILNKRWVIKKAGFGAGLDVIGFDLVARCKRGLIGA